MKIIHYKCKLVIEYLVTQNTYPAPTNPTA